MSEVHAADRAAELIALMRKDGFNGVWFDEVSQYRPEREEDEQTEEEYQEWMRDYACFCLLPDLYCDYDSGNGYATVEVDFYSFYDDLEAFILEFFGPGFEIISRSRPCGEYVVQRAKD